MLQLLKVLSLGRGFEQDAVHVRDESGSDNSELIRLRSLYQA